METKSYFFGAYLCFLIFRIEIIKASSSEEDEETSTSLYAAVGSHITFNCEIEFPNDLEIPYELRWNKDGEEIFSWYDGDLVADPVYRGRITLLDDHQAHGFGRASINLTAIRESDSGWYECRIIFPNRSPSSRNNGTWFHLEVDGGALLAIPPVNQTTLEGERAHFACTSKDPDSTVEWYKDGVPLSELVDLRHRVRYGPQGGLTVGPVMMGDLGEYVCAVTNAHGDRQTARAYLNVQYKAKVVYAPREAYLPLGKPAVLDCHFRSNPPLTNLRWEKDGFLFDPYNVPGVFYRRNGSLFFSKVEEQHAGHYTCTPYNELGTEGPSPMIHVIVQRPPSFTVTPVGFYLRKIGDTLEMPCDARDGDGTHRPTIVWIKKDGTELPRGRYSIDGGNLTIENIQKEDRGMYQCSASNDAATVTADAELMIETLPPRAPYNVTANSTSNSIYVSWAEGYRRPRLVYKVWYRAVDVSEWRTMRVSSSQETEANITNLMPAQEYELMIMSEDANGDGMFSKAIKVYTKPSQLYTGPSEFKAPLDAFLQISAPTFVQVIPVKEGHLVTWRAPEHGAESLRRYIVRWTRSEYEFKCGSAETQDTQYLVTDLEEDELYTFQVLAMSTTDYQAASHKVEVRVPPYTRIRAVTIGVAAALLICAVSVAVLIYARRKCIRPDDTSDEEKQPETKA